MQIRLLCVPLCLGWILFGARPSWTQDLSVPGKDLATLQKQISALDSMITSLTPCVEQKDGFESEKMICQKALDQRRGQQAALKEIAALKGREESADIPPNLKPEIAPLISELGKRYLRFSGGSPIIPVAQPARAPGKPGGQFLRTIVGFEQAGASASNSTQKFFFDLLLTRPLHFHLARKRNSSAQGKAEEGGFDLGPRMRSWGNLRISSVPQQISASVAQFATTFAQTVGELKVNQVAQSFEFLGGVDFRLLQTPGLRLGPDRETSQRITFSLVLGGGVITPLTPLDSVQIFKVPSNQPGFLVRFPQASGKQFVAFTLPDRDRFFRQAYGGIRVMTHHFEANGDVSTERLPATLDVTYGFNESVTGGRIRGGVMRLEGFVPLPGRLHRVYLFGTGLFKPGAHALIESPFLLDAAPTGTLPTDPNAVVITVPQINRDYYRLGVGIDLVDLVANWKRANPTAASTTTSTSPQPPK